MFTPVFAMQIMSATPDGYVTDWSSTKHDSIKAAQQHASHWTHEMIERGLMPEGMVVTYVLSSVPPVSWQLAAVVDVVTYKHAETTSQTSNPEVTTE